MGWSCRAEASKTEQAWNDGCRAQTGSSNTFATANGQKYFYERSNVEHRDGAITGVIWKYVGEDMARRSGTFRINGDGTIERAPKTLKDFAKSVTDEFERRAVAARSNPFATRVAY